MVILRTISHLVKKILKVFYTKKIKFQAGKVGRGLRVNGKSSVSKQTVIGDFVSFNGMNINGIGDIYIGNYFHSGEDCLMISSNHNYEGTKIPYDHTNLKKQIVIEDFVWMGSKVTVLGNVRIGEGAIIQAGAVVVKDIPQYGIAGGNPAKVFKFRDKEHFIKLKQEGSFH